MANPPTPSDELGQLLLSLIVGSSCHLSQLLPYNDGGSSNVGSLSATMGHAEEILPRPQEQSNNNNNLLFPASSAPSSEIVEDPVMVDRLLASFEQEVERGGHAIYKQALNQDSSYVEDPAFRLKFLRANQHDVKKSVMQMISFLSHKAKYFGNDKLSFDITIDDMTPDELKIILSGLYHVQTGADRDGRVILHRFNRFMQGKYSAETMIRVNYYIWFNILIPMHAVQKKGVVAVCYDIQQEHTQSPPAMKSMMQVADFMSCLPIRYSDIHFCLKVTAGNLPLRDALLRFSVSDFPAHVLESAKIHYGSDVELQRQLSEHGIPLDTFPVDKHGNLREGVLNLLLYNHLQENENFSSLEADPSQVDNDTSSMQVLSSRPRELGVKSTDLAPNAVVDGIWDTDILLGRGRLVQYHPGNISFREYLDERKDRYELLSRNQRRNACSDFTRELLASGTRFLRQTDNELWVICAFDEIVGKVAQYFRTKRRGQVVRG